MEAAISMLSSASAVAARPMTYTPSEVAMMAAASSAVSGAEAPPREQESQQHP